MSTKTIQTVDFPRLTRFTAFLETSKRRLWTAISVLAVGDAASTFSALTLARQYNETRPPIQEVNPATQGFLNTINYLLETIGIQSDTLDLASLFPRVFLVIAVLYGGYRLLPSQYRVLALPIYAFLLAFATIYNSAMAVELYDLMVLDSGFHIMLAIMAGTVIAGVSTAVLAARRTITE